MKVLFACIFVALSISLSATDAQTVLQNKNRFQETGRRSEGSIQEREAFDLIATEIARIGLPFNRYNFTEDQQGHSYSQTLEVTIPGESDRFYVLAAPLEHGAFGTSVIIEVAEFFAATPPQHSIILLFLGGERGDSEGHPYGSRQAISRINWSEGSFVIYLDAEELPQYWKIILGGDGKIAPFWLTKALMDTVNSASIPHRLRSTDIHVANIGIQDNIGELKVWLDAEIPTVLLRGNGGVETEEEEQHIQALVEGLISMDSVIDDNALMDTETIYTYFKPLQNMKPHFIRERPFVFTILILIIILITVILLKARKATVNFRRFARQWWTFYLLLFVIFLFLFLTTLFIEETLQLVDFPDLWTHAPGIFLFFKYVVAMSLSLIFIWISDVLPLPRSPHFYSYLATISSGILTLISMAVDMTLSIYTLWTAVLFLIFTMIRNIRWKMLLLFLATLPYGIGLAVIIIQPYMTILELLLLSRIKGNIVMTLFFMPIILAVTSLNYWRRHYYRVRQNVLTPAATLALSISSVITLMWIMQFNPYKEGLIQPVQLLDYIDISQGKRRMEVDSPGPIGNIQMALDGTVYPLQKLGRKAEIRTALTDIPLQISTESRFFLGRRTIFARLSGEKAPYRLNIVLDSDKPLTVHEANFPFETAPSGQMVTLYIGDTPPFPTDIRFTVNDDANLSIQVTAIWDEIDNPPSIDRKDLDVSIRRIARIKTQP